MPRPYSLLRVVGAMPRSAFIRGAWLSRDPECFAFNEFNIEPGLIFHRRV